MLGVQLLAITSIKYLLWPGALAPKTQCLGEELEFFIYLLQKNLWKGTEGTQLTSLFKMVAEVSY